MVSSPESLAQQLKEEIQNAELVLIGTHLNPDGDALGSALALSEYLTALGKPHEVLCHHLPPDNLRFLPGVNRVRQSPELTGHELGIVVDLESLERLGSTAPYFERCPRLAVIDHHVPHEAPGDLRIIDEQAAATAVILTRILLQLDAEITPDIADCLLTGIVTDTGSFRFRNTNPEALTLAAKLLECGGDVNRISEEVFHRKPLSSLRLLGILLENMHIECEGQLAWAALSRQDFEACEARDEDTEGFVNELLAVNTVQVAALFREPKPGRIRISLRSRGEVDVAEIARAFGGGGHKNAAGISQEMPLADVLDLVVPRLRQCWASS